MEAITVKTEHKVLEVLQVVQVLQMVQIDQQVNTQLEAEVVIKV